MGEVFIEARRWCTQGCRFLLLTGLQGRLQICGEDESDEAIILSVCISTKSKNSKISNAIKTMYVSGESVKSSQMFKLLCVVYCSITI